MCTMTNRLSVQDNYVPAKWRGIRVRDYDVKITQDLARAR